MNVCLRDLKEATQGLLNASDAKALMDHLQTRARDKAAQGVEDLTQALESSAREILEAKQRAKLIQKRNAYINILRKRAIDQQIQGFKDPFHGLQSVLGGIQSNIKNARYSTDALQKSTIQHYCGLLGRRLDAEDVRAAFNDKNLELPIAQELWEEGSSGNAQAAKVGRIIREVQEVVRKEKNAAGADIGRAEHYLTSQSHDPGRLARTSDTLQGRLADRQEAWRRLKNAKAVQKDLYEQAYIRWRDFILPRLDPEKTFEGADPEKFLRGAYEGLRSGIHKVAPEENNPKDFFKFTGPGNLAKRLSEGRVFHFKDAQSWVDYNSHYGGGSVQHSVLKSLIRSGRQVGLMKIWGTNPRALFDRVSREVMEKARTDPKARSRRTRMRHIFDELDGTANMPEDHLLAKIGSSVRAVISMAKLGNIVWSSLPDLSLQASVLRDHGLGLFESYGRAISQIMEGRPAGERKEISDALGTWAESQYGHTLAYFSAADTPCGKMTQMMQTFFKYTGMHWWDEVNRTSLGTTISRLLAQSADRDFSKLDGGQQRALRLYGIEEKEWDLIRRGPMKAADNKHYITPEIMRDIDDEPIATYLGKTPKDAKAHEIREVRRDLEDRLRTFFIDQVDHANLQLQALDRSLITGDARAGTFKGEIWRFIGQFKYFSMSYIRRVLGRQLYGHGAESLTQAFLNGQGDLVGLAHVIVGSTLLGYLAMSAKDVFKGREPRAPSSPSTWTAAFLQGGGLGIYGDFLFGQANRFGQSLLDTVAGPALGSVADIYNILQLIRSGEDPTNATFRFLKNNTPFINLFYTRIALDYLVLYGLQERLNPGSLERMQRTIEKENNQKFIFPPSQYAIRY